MTGFSSGFSSGFGETVAKQPLIYINGVVRFSPVTSKSSPGFPTRSIQRLPTDPLYIADVDVQNSIVGSAYNLGYDDNGSFVSLASGTVATSSFTISNVSAFAIPFLMELRLRKGTSATKYIPLRQFAFHNSAGITIYVSQVEDGIA